MKLTLKQLTELFNAMHSIDSHESTTIKPEANLKLVVNLNKIRPTVEAFSKVQRKLELSNISEKMEPKKVLEVERQMAALAAKSYDFDLETIKLADLDRGSNKRITNAQVLGLTPILDDAPTLGEVPDDLAALLDEAK